MMTKDQKTMLLSKGNTSMTIHSCAESGDLIGLQTLLRLNPSHLNETNRPMVQTPLHIAASLNKVEITKYLLDWKGPGEANLEAKNVYGETPLHMAAKNGCNDTLKLLLDSGAYVEATTSNSMTPLHLAVGYALRSGDNSTVNTLLEYNADCSAKDDEGKIPFNYLPADLQNEELIRLLKINVPNQINNSTAQIDNTTTRPRSGNSNLFNIYTETLNNIMGGSHFYEERLNNIMGQLNTSDHSRFGNQTPVDKYTELLNNMTGRLNTSDHSRFGNQNPIDPYTQLLYNLTGQSDDTLDYSRYATQNPIDAYTELLNNMTGQSNTSVGNQNPIDTYTQQINNIMGQSSTPGHSLPGYPNGPQTLEEPRNDHETGIEAKMAEFEDELSKIVGLHKLKLQLKKWAKGMLMDEKRRAMGINLGPRKPPHMAFLGNPGTGKTSIARILGKLLKSVGVLSSDNVIEVQRTDLIAEYTGQTGPKTRKKIKEAMWATLFVDEAYRLAPEQKAGDDFGVEALEEIMSVLEDGNLVVIFAGYTEPMKRVFASNQGFCRRVTHFFQFEDFTCKDLAEMVMIKMSKQNEKSRLYGFKLHPSCTFDVVLRVIEKNSTEKLRSKMNGGLVDHMLNNARETLDSRLTFNSKGDELLTITASDLEGGLKMLSEGVNVE